MTPTEREREEAKMFPVLRNYSREARPGPTSIPWSVADKAYAVYRARYGTGQSLQRLADRGGFADSELDDLYPGWREEVAEITRLRLALSTRSAYVEKLEAEVAFWREGVTLCDEPICETCIIIKATDAARLAAESKGGW